jgi:hypothetical protein
LQSEQSSKIALIYYYNDDVRLRTRLGIRLGRDEIYRGTIAYTARVVNKQTGVGGTSNSRVT